MAEKYTSAYTGEEIDEAIEKINDIEVPESLSDLTDDSTHRTVTDAEKSTWNGKQSAISDLSTIRSGAAAGATAYQKPSAGIPASDLASGVIPTVPTKLSQLTGDSTHRVVSDTEKSAWNAKQSALTAGTGISISGGVISCTFADGNGVNY